MDRLTSIDVCRGIAIICMITADLPVVKNVGINPGIEIIRHSAGTFAAPFFLFIAGVSYELFVISRLERNRDAINLNIETFWKAILLLVLTQIIFFVGVLLFPSRFSVSFNSSVFLVIAVGYLLSMVIPRKWIYNFPIIFIPFILAYYVNNPLRSSLFFLFSNPFPLIPFVAYFFAGRAIFIFYEKIDDLHMLNRQIPVFSALFVAMMAIVFLIGMVPVTAETRTEILGFLLLVGAMICILSSLSVYYNRFKEHDFFLVPFERTGRIAFSVYYAFFVLELVIFPNLNLIFIANLDPKIQIAIYFLSIIMILIIITNVEKFWRKVGYIFGFEWFLRYGSVSFTKITRKYVQEKSE